MSSSPRTIRIFISSPGDVAEERDKARTVIESLQRHYPEVMLKPFLWEELPLDAIATHVPMMNDESNRSDAFAPLSIMTTPTTMNTTQINIHNPARIRLGRYWRLNI